MKHISSYILVLVSLLQSVYGQQTNNQNYIISRIYKQAGANASQVDKVNIQVQYMDGLGRIIQTLGVKQSPTGSDIIQSVEYDALGRQAKQYLPYVASANGAFQDAATAAPIWYTTNSALLKADDLTRPFSETFYESTPLGRLTGQRAPGGKSANSSLEYKVNTTNESIKRYDFSSSLNLNGSYGPGQLTVLQNTDEYGKVVRQYTDMLGQMICKQVVVSPSQTQSTYYVYDDNGWLRVVLQPKYQNDNNLTNYAFQYDYDSRGRVIVKKIPGSGITEIVYDKYDRPVMSRDANQTARGFWGFTKYDALNRPVITGEIQLSSDRVTLAGSVDTGTEHHEIRNNSANEGYTLNKTAPTNATLDNLRTITFYDDYAFSKGSSMSYNAASGYGTDPVSLPKTYSTGGRSRVLLSSGSMGDWLTNVIYYDAEYRPIQSVRELYDLGSTAIERISIKYLYDLAAVVAEQKTEQILSASVTNTHLATYTYDHADRLLSVKEKVTNGLNLTSKEAFTIAQRYNTLGQLQSKWFHSTDNIKYRHRTDYTNNIRGWVTDGKTVYKTLASSPDKSIFAFGMEYKKDDGNYTNGSISKAQWRSKDESDFTAGLTFEYDGASRLSGSTGISYANVPYPNKESNILYDENGNITNLTRSGASVDNLTYQYTGTGNKLFSISDNSGNDTGVKNGTYGYTYDGNGNMLTDDNRGAVITYNFLNLPRTVVINGKTLAYDYDASGDKHKYVGATMTLKYANAFEYKRVNTVDSLYRIGLNDAQAVYRNGSLKFEYYVKDHLGNVRVVFDETGKIIQKSDFYPFGLEINKDNPVTTQAARTATNRYLYNGKEMQEGSGYIDFGARMYMPEIGRWGAADPLTEERQAWSTYNYTRNNPMLNIDPTGALDQEYTSADAYKKDNPNGALDGLDGHWLTSDRESNSNVWGVANLINLLTNRYNDYKTISQRRDFYGWYAQTIDKKGFDNKWPGAAYIVAGQMSKLDRPEIAWFVGEDVVKFGNAGNKAIFNDVFDNLKDLLNGSPMKGAKAGSWDAATLHNEQFNVVQQIYMKQSEETLSILSKMAKGQGIYGIGVTEALRFKGDIKNPQDRYNHGAGKVTNFYNLQQVYWKLGW